MPTAIPLTLDEPAGEYASVVSQRLAPFTAEAVDGQLCEIVLPRLLAGRSRAVRA